MSIANGLFRRVWIFAALTILITALAAQAEDLRIKKSITVGGSVVSTTETAVKGARERSINQAPNGATIALRQCDLNRTVILNEQARTYFVSNDPQDENAARAAAIAAGVPSPEASGGKITVTTTVTDTGERKKMFGYEARHLKIQIDEEPSPDACTRTHQSLNVDGWFADLAKGQAACTQLVPPVQENAGCHDAVIARRLGNGKPGYPLEENVAVTTPGGTSTVTIQVSELTKQELPAELFEVPAEYRQVASLAELNGAPQTQAVQQSAAANRFDPNAPSQVQNANTPMAQAAAAQQAAWAQAAQLGLTQGGMPGAGGMSPNGRQPGGAPVAAPQPLGSKAPGKIRIGVAPPDAQLGQGNNTGADYSTPIRNAEIALMNGPAVEIAALDSRVPMQLQAEAQQKQCDYILYSGVTVKHSSGGGLGRFTKIAAPVASVVPMVGMARGMSGAVAAQAAGAAASAAAVSAQQQAMNQLAGFNGQIKSKDDVTVQYQLVAAGASSPALQNSLNAKAKSNGEDVLTPLLLEAATAVLGEVSKKQ